MAKFSNQRKGGRPYKVLVTDTKHGAKVDTVVVNALNVREARREAITACHHRVIDTTRLYAHGPRRAS